MKEDCSDRINAGNMLMEIIKMTIGEIDNILYSDLKEYFTEEINKMERVVSEMTKTITGFKNVIELCDKHIEKKEE